MKPKFCSFCKLKIDSDKYSEHIYLCSSRTKICTSCNKNIILREYDLHEANCLIAMTDAQNIVYSQPKKTEVLPKKQVPIPKEPQINPAYPISYSKSPATYEYDYKKPLEKDHSLGLKPQISPNPINYQNAYNKAPSEYGKEPFSNQNAYNKVSEYEGSSKYAKDIHQKEKDSYDYKKQMNEKATIKPQANYKPGQQYENYIQKEREKIAPNLYSHQAISNKPILSTNQNKPISNSRSIPVEEDDKKPRSGNSYNFYEKKNSFDVDKDKKRHMQDYNKEVPDKPNFQIKNDSNKGRNEPGDYKQNFLENKSSGGVKNSQNVIFF